LCACYTYYNVGYLLQEVATPNTSCSVCGLPSMAEKPEHEISSLTQGSDTCQSLSVTEPEDTVDSKQSSSVEIKGLSNAVDIQNTGLSGSCLVHSPLMSNAALSIHEDQEHMLEDTDVRAPTEVECRQSDNCEAQLSDGHISAFSEQSLQECLSDSEESSGMKLLSTVENCHFSTERDLQDTEVVTGSEEQLTQETECDEEVVQVETVDDDQCLVSDHYLGELLSCADCGSSGLYFFLFMHSSQAAYHALFCITDLTVTVD